MRPRVAILSLLIAVALAAAAGADCLVLRGGKRIDTTGSWAVRGNLILVHDITHRALTMTLGIVDFDATLKANAPGARSTRTTLPASPRRASAPGVVVRPAAGSAGDDDQAAHVDLETIKKIQDYSRHQAEQETQMRARAAADLLAQLSGAKPNGRSGDSGSQGQAQGRARARGSEPSAGFQAVKNCTHLQDNPSAYSACLAGN